MRVQSLLAACAASVLLLPLAAHAGKFPPGGEQAYMAQCQPAATAQGLSAADAKQHCECGATALKAKLSDKEIKDLDSKDGVDAPLMQKAQMVVQEACMKDKQ
ncbi:hypothetical protein ACE1YR_19295 [Pseudomonas sp. K1(2024)]|uniref:Secreted protein n=2 Tax=Pseudomonas TaxID=286 RepID=A0AAI8KA20_9PSED|nr:MULTISPECIES: hypothetical protein [Pseudomonas]AXO88001.1 hypothetical protein DZC75_08310 [Pseudomonas parafulva]MDO7902406.1 hypothetical protein [Pseudomonas sp. K13]MDV9030852.1 hypothetical protein [Pseudomonas sp. RAC1]